MAQTYKGNTLKITLTKSLIGRNKKHIATAKSLGLNKISQTVTQPNNACTVGKINKIIYMIAVEEAE